MRQSVLKVSALAVPAVAVDELGRLRPVSDSLAAIEGRRRKRDRPIRPTRRQWLDWANIGPKKRPSMRKRPCHRHFFAYASGYANR